MNVCLKPDICILLKVLATYFSKHPNKHKASIIHVCVWGSSCNISVLKLHIICNLL